MSLGLGKARLTHSLRSRPQTFLTQAGRCYSGMPRIATSETHVCAYTRQHTLACTHSSLEGHAHAHALGCRQAGSGGGKVPRRLTRVMETSLEETTRKQRSRWRASLPFQAHTPKHTCCAGACAGGQQGRTPVQAEVCPPSASIHAQPPTAHPLTSASVKDGRLSPTDP